MIVVVMPVDVVSLCGFLFLAEGQNEDLRSDDASYHHGRLVCMVGCIYSRS